MLFSNAIRDVFLDPCSFVNFVYVTFDDQINARYLTLYHHKGLRYISICELEIYGTECKYGYYGPSCSQSCGHCNNGDPCDDVTGECSNCAAGYRGTQCYDVCTDGSYGSNCVDVCGECFNGEPCDKIDGTCVHCDPGYQGKLCDTECSRRTYGQNCSEVCGFCHENAHCNHVTGRCVGGCVAGRRGSLCKQECETNSFGENCLYTCHCKDGVSCDSVTGSCEDGACADGFSGLGCQQSLPEKDNSQSQPNNPISLPISVGVGVFLICTTVGLVVYVVYLKRRITRAETPNAGSNGTDTQPYDDLQY